MEFIFSFVQHTMLKTLIQVYPTSVQELVYWYRCATLTRNATAAYTDATCERRTDAAVALHAIDGRHPQQADFSYPVDKHTNTSCPATKERIVSSCLLGL